VDRARKSRILVTSVSLKVFGHERCLNLLKEEFFMQIKILFSVAAIAALSSIGAWAQDQNEVNFFASSVVGSTPGVTVAGVAAGGAPWTVKAAVANVAPNGQIFVKLVGLLIAAAPGGPCKSRRHSWTGERSCSKSRLWGIWGDGCGQHGRLPPGR
jgi:hypothetical protein